MKKLIVIVSILFSVNSFGQMTNDTTLFSVEGIKKDTSFYVRGNTMSMTIKYSQFIQKESPLYNQGLIDKQRKKRRKDRIFSIVTGVVFASLSTWFWSGYHQ
jgi:hypothetical protein